MSNLSFDERNALDVLQTAVTVINQVGSLRLINANYEAQHAEDTATIANLTDVKHGLEATLAETQQQLADALARETQLRADLADTQAKLVDEQRLAGEHWSNLQQTEKDRAYWQTETYAARAFHNAAKSSLEEAEGKLSRFRDILGIPHPVNSPATVEPVSELTEQAVEVVPVPTELPSVEPVTNVIDLPNPFKEAEAVKPPTEELPAVTAWPYY